MIDDNEYIENINKRLEETQFFVQANSFARQVLWEKYHNKINWESESYNYTLLIGEIDKRQILLSLTWARLNDKLVLFWGFHSSLQDYGMAEKFFSKYTPKWDKGTRLAHTNDWNFHHCYHFVTSGE